ncbi:hypothetical protein BH11MYX3_BH11MYX3_06420 [soil metagenome]
MRTWFLVVVALVGCGEHGQGGPDAQMEGAPDGVVDAGPMATGAHHRYVVSHERVPTNNNQAREFGLDLNGDKTVDNQLGMVLGTLSSMGFNIQVTTESLVDRGGLLMLLDVQADDFTAMTNAGVTVYKGATPTPTPCQTAGDTVCRRHLTGSGMFTVPAASAHDVPLVGAIVGGTLLTTSTSGKLHVQFVFSDGPSPPIELELIGARIKASGLSATAIRMANLAGAISETEIHAKLTPGIQASFAAAVRRDCTALTAPPGCGCLSNSTGKLAVDLFDGDLNGTQKDCVISLAEVEGSSLIQSLLAPDLTINGVNALSLGLQVDAVAAKFTP